MYRKFLTFGLVLLSAISITACGKGTFEVKTKNNTTSITIPAEYNPSEELPILLEEQGFKYSGTDKDGAVTYTISENEYKQFLDYAKESINKYVDDLNTSENYPSIESININKSYDKISAVVKKDEFNNSSDELAINALALKIAHYQGYKGETISVKIEYTDSKTNKVYDDVTIE